MKSHITQATLYWALAGALMGLGIITTFSIGIPLVLIGIFFMSYGLAKMEHRGLWAALVSILAMPGGLLLYNYFAVDNDSRPPTGNNLLLVVLVFVIVASTYMTLVVFKHLQASKV